MIRTVEYIISSMQILLVEDTKKIAENISDVLRFEHFTVAVASTGEEALELIEVNTYDLIILDLSLPDIDGQEVTKILRKNKVTTPLLMLTARIDLDSKIEGLNSGADDYLTKPFLMDELLARVKALLRRTSSNKSNTVEIKDLEIDLNTRQLKKNDQVVALSPIEMNILEFLIMNQGVVQSASQIYESVWGSHNSDVLFSDTLKVHIARLRKKIGADIIKTVPGSGYVIITKV